MRSKFALSFCFFVVICCVAEVAKAQFASPIHESEIADHSSVYDAYLTNMLAWESGDFLVKVTTIQDSTNRNSKAGDFISEITTTYRIRFDHPAKRYLVFRKHQYEILLLELPNVDVSKVPKKWEVQTAFRFVDDEVVLREFPRKARKLRMDYTPASLFNKYHIPEFRTAGLVSVAGGKINHLLTIIPKLASGYGVTSARHNAAGNLEFFRRAPVPGSGGDQFFVTRVEFDDKCHMPILKDSKIEVTRENKTKKLIQNFKERVKWQEIGGVQVPESLTNESSGFRSFEGNSIGYDKTVDMQFKWISLNTEIPEEDFDVTHLNHFESMTDFEKYEKEEIESSRK